ncbi:DUF1766-domain-containing protein [Xylona heveae TC161]|uniref:DUF1766-domain-containing protein n=1 Tax=Xylona heveae (strain CBS 132557 / TC161) TaxID=1328760 RepID=A0A165GK92_XYLHT|nr:DUF1766-domain-containing protein [Xylona heveae TC161]KZF22292.1 DUF1766-domain-containing protein [Xylona heveae TC161]
MNMDDKLAAGFDYPSGPPKTRETADLVNFPTPPGSPPQEKSHANSTSALLTPPPSPVQKASNLIVNAERTDKEKPWIDAAALKTRLGLGNWKCGSKTKTTGAPCKNPARGEHKEIDLKIVALTTFTKSSPELEDKLRKLVGLVHCKWHVDPKWKEDRVERWTSVFPPGADGTKPYMDIGKQIRKALGPITPCCIVEKGLGKICELEIGGQKVQNCQRTVQMIVEQEIYNRKDVYLDYLLRVLEVNQFCVAHKKYPLKNWESRKASIVEILKNSGAELVEPIDDNTPETADHPGGSSPCQGTEATLTSQDKDNSKKHIVPTSTRSRFVPPDLEKDPADFWPAEYDITPFDIIERSSQLSNYKSSYEEVRKQMREELDSIDREDGYVYLYEVEGNNEFVKIGYTGRTPDVRHEEWEFTCNRVPKALYPVPFDPKMKVPNARRVEALCHAELRHRQIRHYCKLCDKQHLEWFEISPAEAIAIIRKWSEWMRTQPYRLLSLRNKDMWILKHEERARSYNMDKFMKETSELIGKQERAVSTSKK